MSKTRVAYYIDEGGNPQLLGDTIDAALEANITVKEYERQLIESNPDLEIIINIEPKLF